MKNLLFSLVAMICTLSAAAQSPQAFNYQGIARDVSGSPLANRDISLRLSVLQGSLRSVVYQETHNVTTSKLGIFSTEVGHGSSPLGLLEDVEWGIAEHYIQVELDPDGGTNYSLLGESQLLSVPYALYAGNVAGGEEFWQSNVRGIHYNDGNVGIGTDRPDARLTVQGNDPVGNDRMYLDLNNQSTSNRSLVWLNLSAGEQNSATSLQHFSETYDFDGDKYNDFGILASSGRGIILRADDPKGVIKFLAGGSIQSSPERMRISELGNVGIGTQNPSHKLSIEGRDDTGDNRNYLHLNNQSTSNRSLVWVNLTAGAQNSATSLQHFSETYDFDGNKYTDFGILASSGRGIILRADDPKGVIKFLAGGSIQSSPERMRISELGNVGIGTQNPSHKLSIEGRDDTGDNRNYLHLNNQSTSNRSLVWVNLTAGAQNSATSLQHFSETYDFDGDKYTDFGILASSGRGIILRADDPKGVIKFLAGGSIQSSPERMRIDELGNVGIGTQNPSTRVQVAGGDVYIQDINNGVIMKSPNGGCWRLTVNNDGSIKTTVITCPD